MSIRYGTAGSSLGTVLVAVESRGICDIILGNSPRELEADYAARHPDAVPGADPALVRMIAESLDHLHEFPALPLSLHGTDFQQKVWRALQDIPPGETRSYAAIAQALGLAGSARAVARACAANRLAIAIPCHRVVKSDGSLSGYRWGAERKARLLAREKQARTHA